jgi:hypothetical protein
VDKMDKIGPGLAFQDIASGYLYADRASSVFLAFHQPQTINTASRKSNIGKEISDNIYWIID